MPRVRSAFAILLLLTLVLPVAARASDDLQARCDEGHARSCALLAVRALRGGDSAGAAALFQRACANGHARSCYNLGRLYEQGRGVRRDPGFARALFADACDGGIARACRRAPGGATMAPADEWTPDEGEATGGRAPSRHGRRALDRLKRACNALDERACEELGELYARLTAAHNRARARR